MSISLEYGIEMRELIRWSKDTPEDGWYEIPLPYMKAARHMKKIDFGNVRDWDGSCFFSANENGLAWLAQCEAGAGFTPSVIPEEITINMEFPGMVKADPEEVADLSKYDEMQKWCLENGCTITKNAEEPAPEPEPTRVTFEGWPKIDDWETVANVGRNKMYPELSSEFPPPAIVIRRHRTNGSIRVDIFDCQGGLDVSYTNGAVGKDCKDRATGFRDISTSRDALQPITVRFLARGAGRNLELKS